jgi:hypothetical protein
MTRDVMEPVYKIVEAENPRRITVLNLTRTSSTILSPALWNNPKLQRN